MSAYILWQFKPLSSGLHLDGRWAWRWAAFWHAPAPPLGSCSTGPDSWCSAEDWKTETEWNRADKRGIVIVTHSCSTVFQPFLAVICSMTWFFKDILSPRLEQRIPECVKSHSAGLFQTRFRFATQIKSGKDSRLRCGRTVTQIWADGCSCQERWAWGMEKMSTGGGLWSPCECLLKRSNTPWQIKASLYYYYFMFMWLQGTVVTISLKRCVIFYLVQLPAEALENVMLVNLENRLALVEDSVHDHTQRVHVGGWVTADGQDVLGGQVLRVGEAERREIGLPLFTCVLRLKRTREHKNENLESSRQGCPACKTILRDKDPFCTHLSVWGVGGGDAEVEAHDLPGSALVEDDVLQTQVPVDHFHATVEEGQTLGDLEREREREREKKMWKCQGELEPDGQ